MKKLNSAVWILFVLSISIVLAACSYSAPKPSDIPPAANTVPIMAPTPVPTPESMPVVVPTPQPAPTPVTPAPKPVTTVPAPKPTPKPVSVSIQDFAFSSGNLTVPAGTKVTWINKDSMGHTVTSDSGAFDSGTLSNGASYTFTFNQAGTFSYHCAFHPSMQGTITVTP